MHLCVYIYTHTDPFYMSWISSKTFFTELEGEKWPQVKCILDEYFELYENFLKKF